MARAHTSRSGGHACDSAGIGALSLGMTLGLWACSHPAWVGCSDCGEPRLHYRRSCYQLEATRLAPSQADALDETSGIVPATSLPGAFWVHNDSGDGPRLYALARDGSLLGQVELEGAEAVDWEDLSAAPGTEGAARDLVVADVGDNFARRNPVQLYRIPEPSAEQLGGKVTARRIDLHWPDGPHDVEALFVDPVDGSAYLVEKTSNGPGGVYRVDLSSPHPAPERVGSVELRTVTAADMSPDATRIAIRNYTGAVFFDRAPGQSVAQALRGRGCLVMFPTQRQGESLAFIDTNTLVTLSEGAHRPLYLLQLHERRPSATTRAAEDTR